MKNKSQIKVYHEIDENYYSASSQSFIGNIYELLNLNNIADLADTKRPGWSAIGAVKKNQLLIIDADVGSRWGPRIIEFAKAIVKGIVLH